ncbi:MAG: DUF2378 family protein [Myxococcaceae bacterium]|nr:DUF2378 family protein [Myxococcaceae bacterium]
MATSSSAPKGPTPVKITSPDFERRLALATADDTAKGMFFNGVVQAVGKLVNAQAATTCLAAVGDRKFVDFFNYPIAWFLRLSFTAAELLAPAVGGHESAFRKLGMQATHDFLATGVGKTLLLLAGRDAKRLLTAVPGAFKTAVSYGERRVDFSGNGAGTLTMRRDFMPPAYHEGVLIAVLQAVGAKNVSVVGKAVGPLDADYHLRWDPEDEGGQS